MFGLPLIWANAGKVGLSRPSLSSHLQGSLALGIGRALLRIVSKHNNTSILSGCIFSMHKLSFDCNYVTLQATKVMMTSLALTGVSTHRKVVTPWRGAGIRALLCSEVRAHSSLLKLLVGHPSPRASGEGWGNPMLGEITDFLQDKPGQLSKAI